MFTVTWLRAYHTRRLERADEILNRLDESGLVVRHDDDNMAFFDIQALRSSHFASAAGPAVWMTEEDGAKPPLKARSHVLAHASGFLVIRLTLSSADNPELEAPEPADLARWERLPWEPAQVAWSLDAATVHGNVRHCLNMLFMLLHERLMSREVDASELIAWAPDGPHGNARLQELCEAGELSHPLPVSFGTHIEIVDSDLANDPQQRLEFAQGVLLAASGGEDWDLTQVKSDSSRAVWYVLENQSLVFRPDGSPGPLDVVDPLRMQLLEFLTLRRAALRSIQRDTQRVLTGGRAVSRRRIDEWRLLLATTTDDYVLHDRVARVMVPLSQHLRSSPYIRNPDILEHQVRTNIESFQARIEMASQSVSTVIGALFAVVAAVLGVGTAAKALAAERTGVRLSELQDVHPWLTSAIDAGVTVLAFVVTWQIIRRTAAKVPPLRPYAALRRGRRASQPTLRMDTESRPHRKALSAR